MSSHAWMIPLLSIGSGVPDFSFLETVCAGNLVTDKIDSDFVRDISTEPESSLGLEGEMNRIR